MDCEIAIARFAREWGLQQCPDEPRVAEIAVVVALNCFAGGASVAEACEQARAFVSSWVHHPAHVWTQQGSRCSLAS